MSQVNDHIKDIDFRKREVRQSEALKEIVGWYEELHARLETNYNPLWEAQLQALTSVLWLLMPPTAYKALTKRKQLVAIASEEDVAHELKDMFRED